MTTALAILGFIVLFVVIECWPSPLDRQIRARQRGGCRVADGAQAMSELDFYKQVAAGQQAEIDRLREALREARPYVFSPRPRQSVSCARSVLERVDAALAAVSRTTQAPPDRVDSRANARGEGAA